jgi:thioredoxin reductase
MKNNLQSPFEVDLVIIGGGPTGLLSGVLARSLGLSVYIIGKNTLHTQLAYRVNESDRANHFDLQMQKTVL